MKKWTAVFFTLLFLLNLTGCAGSQQRSDKTSLPTAEPSAETEAENTENRSGESVSETGKTLVVYYSATGNTETAANYIAAEIGADVFVLEPVEPYSDEDLDYNNEESRVVYEHDHPEAREIELVTAAVDNWDTYTTVFIGYPIWWGIAAWPVNGFVSENDFTGKTVIPFATSASSDLGESGELLAELAGTGDWLEGKRFSSHVSEDDVRAWLMEEGFLE
ncbi:MAG: flavodoxin [Eubacteriales bacterium]|nr:flavodoxin [Eubacteriales bacterium]